MPIPAVGLVAMRTKIDGAGRLVVPKPIRERLKIGGGSALDIVEQDGVIEIRPARLSSEWWTPRKGPSRRFKVMFRR